MSVNWKVEITMTDLATRRIRATATRTVTSLILGTVTEVRNYSLEGTFDTQTKTLKELQDHLLEVFWGLYQKEVNREAQIALLVGPTETTLAAALKAKESE